MGHSDAESQDAINQREWESPWNWSPRGFYSSKADNRLWVPKRPGTGIGDALNFAHPGAKLFLFGLSIPALVGLALGIFLVFFGPR